MHTQVQVPKYHNGKAPFCDPGKTPSNCRSLAQCDGNGRITIIRGLEILWEGLVSELLRQPELVAKVWPRGRSMLRRAALVERSIRSAERGRHRGCVQRPHWPANAPDERAYLGTPIHRVNYIDTGGRSRYTPGFALKANARRALEIIREKGFKAIIVS